ncbi:hypothetical protein [Nocardioides sp. 616]|uniref:hypothetical protein n=1 Tax=Nocardioides sp. 616 TaxID=2268090 RepID=UPI0013B415F8|nr:hypothetical protein [Nocardioides sp. 616]
MNYREPVPATRRSLGDALSSGSTDRISEALIGLVLTDPDLLWLQGQCLDLLHHEDDRVRGAALTSLGHLARIHGQIDRSKVEPVVRSFLEDPVLAGRAEDALDDFDVFAPNDE